MTRQPSDNYKWKVFWVLSLALFTMVMDFSVTNIALPSIAGDFALHLRVVSWVAIAGALTVSAVLLPLGRLADITGRKMVHLIGMALFALGALASSLSPNLTFLIAARIVMAIGGAMDQAVVTAIIIAVFPAQERGKGLGMLTTAVGIGAVAGPIVGGPLVGSFGWRSVYLFLFFPTVICFILSIFVLDDARIGTVRRRQGERYDWIGALTSSGALALAIFTINNPLDLAWTSGPVIFSALLTLLLLVAFVLWELRVKIPMINLRLFANSLFSWSTSARFLGFFGSSAVWFLMPFYLQDVLAYSPRDVGLVIFVGAFAMAITGAFSGRLSDRFGYRIFTFFGLGFTIIMGLLFSTLDFDTPLYVVMSALALNGMGMGLWMAPNMSSTLGSVDPTSYGIVSAFLNLVRNVATVTSVAVTTLIVTTVMVGRGVEADLGAIGETGAGLVGAAFLAGTRMAYLILAGFSFCALVAAIMSREGSRKVGHTAVGGPVPERRSGKSD